jgi:hypothetical protein
MKSLFEPVDYRTLMPLTNTWKQAVSVAVEAAFMDSGRIHTVAADMGLGTRALLEISDYYTDKTAPNATNEDWLNAGAVLGKMLVL